MAAELSKIGIIGLGYVGGAVRHWFESQLGTHQLFFYDKFKNIGSLDEVNRADVIFIAVPTPYHARGAGYDDSAVRESVSSIKDGKTVVIKSTVLPGTTEALQVQFPNKTILFNPEFLRAKTPVEDFIHPDKQIVGYAQNNQSVAEEVLKLLPRAPYARVMPAGEAEMAKYFNNTFLAVRVIFANQIYDLCQKLDINYESVKESAAQDPRIGGSHFGVSTDGYRGYGGACFPKDTKALIQFAKNQGISLPLLETMEGINKELNGDFWCD